MAAALVRIALGCLLLGAGVGCAAKASAPEPPVAVAEVTEPGADVAVEEDVAVEADEQPKETCDGVLDCTFFGLGAVLAAPFWVLGAFLGLVF
jgi:hypothetical protein